MESFMLIKGKPKPKTFISPDIDDSIPLVSFGLKRHSNVSSSRMC